MTADGDSILDFSSQYVCTSLGYDIEVNRLINSELLVEIEAVAIIPE